MGAHTRTAPVSGAKSRGGARRRAKPSATVTEALGSPAGSFWSCKSPVDGSQPGLGGPALLRPTLRCTRLTRKSHSFGQGYFCRRQTDSGDVSSCKQLGVHSWVPGLAGALKHPPTCTSGLPFVEPPFVMRRRPSESRPGLESPYSGKEPTPGIASKGLSHHTDSDNRRGLCLAFLHTSLSRSHLFHDYPLQ